MSVDSGSIDLVNLIYYILAAFAFRATTRALHGSVTVRHRSSQGSIDSRETKSDRLRLLFPCSYGSGSIITTSSGSGKVRPPTPAHPPCGSVVASLGEHSPGYVAFRNGITDFLYAFIIPQFMAAETQMGHKPRHICKGWCCYNYSNSFMQQACMSTDFKIVQSDASRCTEV